MKDTEERMEAYRVECNEYFKNNPPAPNPNPRTTNRERLERLYEIFGVRPDHIWKEKEAAEAASAKSAN